MKIGLIGCGGMGTTHNLSLKALSGKMDVEVTALADCRQEFLERAAKQWPGAKTYTTGMELLREEELDAVHICLPSYLHAEHAIAAMEKGMDVFLEKPVCLTREDCSRLLEVQKKTGARVMVGQVVRSFGEYRYLKDIYEKKTYGKLKSIVMQRISGDTKWGYEDWFHEERKSGSVVLDLHIHDLDFLRYMLGEPDSFTVKAAAFPGGMINQIITSYQFGSVFATAEGIWDVCTELPFEGSFRACFEEATIIYQAGRRRLCRYIIRAERFLSPNCRRKSAFMMNPPESTYLIWGLIIRKSSIFMNAWQRIGRSPERLWKRGLSQSFWELKNGKRERSI